MPSGKKNEHFESTQVVLKLKETQHHKRTPTCAKVAISRGEQQLIEGMRKLQKFQAAAGPACQPAESVSSRPADRPEFVN